MTFFLIGFMGAGKSTIGKYAAKQNGLKFLDLDTFIEKWQGAEIRDIFREHGEEHFRKLERQALEDVCKLEEDLLISCGGGTPCFFDNMDLMNSHGCTIYLDLSAARLTDRLRNSKSKRPIISSLKGDLQVFVHRKLMERAPWYSQASIIVEESKSNRKDVSQLIATAMKGSHKPQS